VTRLDVIDACHRSSDVASFFCVEAIVSSGQPPSREAATKLEFAFTNFGASPTSDLDPKRFRFFAFEARARREKLARLKNADAGNAVFGNALAVCFWIFAAVAYNAFVLVWRGQESAFEWANGYVLEWLLSFDNLFVYHHILRVYRTPKPMFHFALFCGIIGAIIFRMLFFLTVGYVVSLAHWLRLILGCLLVYSGVQMGLADDDEDIDVENSIVVQCLSWIMGDRLLNDYDHAGRLFVTHNGRWCVTLLLSVVVLLEVSDLVFALDSVSAKIAQIPDYYIAVTSSALAIFGLRSLFFIVEDLVNAFELLKYGLCLILVLIGVELLVADYVTIPAAYVFGTLLIIFVACICASVVKKHMSDDEDDAKSEPT
jgi:tellurite resistance protein TerC